MSKKKLKLGIRQNIVNELSNVQAFVINNGKEKYLEDFDDLEESISSVEEKIEDYIDDMLPKHIFCLLESKSRNYINDMAENDSIYDRLDMFYTVIDFYDTLETHLGNVMFGIDRTTFNDDERSINAVCVFNVVNDLDISYKKIVDELYDVYKDQDNGIMSLLKNEDFLSYMVADKFLEDHSNEYIYIETLNDVGLPAYFEITPDNVDEVMSLAKQRLELFSKRVSETTNYVVSAVKSDNKNMYVIFNEKSTGNAKFQYQIDLGTEDEYINMAKDDKMSKKKIEKCIDRFKNLHDVEFLLNHVYEIFKVIVYCSTFKKTANILPN